jgi:excinuclease UvrABC nuclease subunit
MTKTSKWLNKTLKTLIITKEDLAALQQPCVYIYHDSWGVLYVGSGTSAGRALVHTHHRVSTFDGAERLEIRLCKTVEEARRLERRLISQLKPRLNGELVRFESGEKMVKTAPIEVTQPAASD